jgi:hypothetical protein
MSTYRTKCDAMIAVAEERAEAAEKALASERARAEKAEAERDREDAQFRQVVGELERIAVFGGKPGDAPPHIIVTAVANALATARREAQEATEALGLANRWILQRAEERERDAKPWPVVWDHACAECIPGGPLVTPGFRCAVHAARALASPVSPEAHDETRPSPVERKP